MKCPKCQLENLEDPIFCRKCGNKLEIVCPKCGRKLSPDSEFCDKCGHNLTSPTPPSPEELSFDEKLEKIQKYLPKGIIDKVLSQRSKIEGEKKEVTVMFCDMAGFTPLVEKIGAERAYAIMDEIYEILIHKVHEFEGAVNEMTGDGVMALFGAPIALENAPQRAIQSSLAIHREITKFNDAKKSEGLWSPIKMRIGIHTGPVVVGTLGNNLRVEFKAVGETVNIASRMQTLAEPGTTYVTEDVFKHALTQEVVYSSMLKDRARNYHEKIAQCLELMHIGHLEEIFSLLAYQYRQSENHQKAYEYLRRSGFREHDRCSKEC